MNDNCVYRMQKIFNQDHKTTKPLSLKKARYHDTMGPVGERQFQTHSLNRSTDNLFDGMFLSALTRARD